MSSNIIIAIDGHSSCGKSTLAKDLAQKLHYIYVDTGAMYRAATLFCIREGYIAKDHWDAAGLERSLSHLDIRLQSKGNNQSVFLNGRDVTGDVRSMEVSRFVSKVSTVKPLREKMVSIQRELGKNKGLVMDGRDIGTVVFPDAELKIFMTADPEERARRRHMELQEKGIKTSFEEVLENILSRDREDSSRQINPLRQAEDARVLDNTRLNRKQQLEIALAWALEAGAEV